MLPAMGEEGSVTRLCSRAAAAGASCCCWGRFGVAAMWRLRAYVLSAGGLNYGPLGYSQNFDDGGLGEGEPNFSARFARHAGATRQPAPAVA
ncbi:hypothetical protein ABZP36_034093 [Zizania latifolia]